jgi:thymidylate kinase
LTIIILEGVNGTGKSTYAEKLSAVLEAPVIRPFRQGPDHHFTGTTQVERELKALGVPYNTHVDDLYTADILGRLLKFNKQMPVILDRSVGSAIAHGERPLRDAGRLLGLWRQSLGADAPVLYVWLTAPSLDCWARLGNRGPLPPYESYSSEHKRLNGLFGLVYDMIPYKKLKIDTSLIGVDEGLVLISTLKSLGKT